MLILSYRGKIIWYVQFSRYDEIFQVYEYHWVGGQLSEKSLYLLYRGLIKNEWLYFTLFYIIFFLLFVCDFCHIYLCFVTKWFKHVKIQIIIVQKLGHVTHQKFKICKIKDYKTSKVFCLDLHKESLELYEI